MHKYCNCTVYIPGQPERSIISCYFTWSWVCLGFFSPSEPYWLSSSPLSFMCVLLCGVCSSDLVISLYLLLLTLIFWQFNAGFGKIIICSKLIPFVWLLNLTTTLKCSCSLGKTRIRSRSRRVVTKMSLSPGPCQNIFWGFLSHVTNSMGATECLMLKLEICGCLLFKESEVFNSAPSMSGVEPDCDQIFRWSWSWEEEVELLYSPVSLKFCVLFFGNLKCFQGTRVATDLSLISYCH